MSDDGRASTAERNQQLRAQLELARGFMPHYPVEARNQVRSVLAELERSGTAPEQGALRAEAQAMLIEYAAAAEAWQTENARRGARHLERELAALERR